MSQSTPRTSAFLVAVLTVLAALAATISMVAVAPSASASTTGHTSRCSTWKKITPMGTQTRTCVTSTYYSDHSKTVLGQIYVRNHAAGDFDHRFRVGVRKGSGATWYRSRYAYVTSAAVSARVVARMSVHYSTTSGAGAANGVAQRSIADDWPTTSSVTVTN